MFLSANVSGFGTLQDELENGVAFEDLDFWAVQEHKCAGERLSEAKTWLRARNWDVVCHPAYFKINGHGGGTAVGAGDSFGVRPYPPPRGLCEGRLTLAAVDLDGEAVVGSIYGFTGKGVEKQLSLWSEMANHLRALGLPFVIAGDWQVSPQAFMEKGLHRLLDAEVCFPCSPTNLESGSVIDWFLVSNSLASGGWSC